MRPVGDVAVDLGTATTQVFLRGEGIVSEDVTYVAVDNRNRKLVSVGRDALDMAAADMDRIELLQPVTKGTVADPSLAAAYLAAAIKPFAGGRMSRFSLLVTVPHSASAMERRVLREAGKRAGASKVRLIEQTMAAAIGAELRVDEPLGTLVASIGAGVTEVSLLSLGTTVAQSSVSVGSACTDDGIASMLRRDYGIVVSPATSELMKLTAASAPASGLSTPMLEAQGLTLLDGSVSTAILDVDDLRPSFEQHTAAVLEALRSTLVQMEPELSQDVILRGVHLAGGGAQSTELATRINETFSIPVHVVANPQQAAAIGAGGCLDAADSLDELFLAERS